MGEWRELARAKAAWKAAKLDAITLDRYGHLLPGNEAEAAGLLDAYLDRAHTAARLDQVGS